MLNVWNYICKPSCPLIYVVWWYPFLPSCSNTRNIQSQKCMYLSLFANIVRLFFNHTLLCSNDFIEILTFFKENNIIEGDCCYITALNMYVCMFRSRFYDNNERLWWKTELIQMLWQWRPWAGASMKTW